MDVMRIVADTVPSMLAYWDSTETCRFANAAYVRWFNVRPENLIGKTLAELLGPELYALNKKFIDGALRGEHQEFEREIPDPLGGPSRHSVASYTPDVDAGGTVRGFSVVVTEITQQKLIERELRGALASVKTLSGMLPICAWCKNVRTDEGYWVSVERYLTDRSDAHVTHGLCETCLGKLAPAD